MSPVHAEVAGVELEHVRPGGRRYRTESHWDLLPVWR